MERQLEEEILSWHLSTFPDARYDDVILKLREELVEVTDEYIHGDIYESLFEEIADVSIVCIRLAHMHKLRITDIFTTKIDITFYNALINLLASSRTQDNLLYDIQCWFSAAWFRTGGTLFEEIKKKHAINLTRDLVNR